MSDSKTDIVRAQSWCFENGVMEVEIQGAWDKALDQDNPIIKNLHTHGFTWRKLAPHLLTQLIQRYGGN